MKGSIMSWEIHLLSLGDKIPQIIHKVRVKVFSLNNISVLLVKETRVTGENH